MCRLQDCENQPIKDEEVIVGGDSGDEDEDDGYRER